MKNSLNSISENIFLKDEIWFSDNKTKISFPDEGYDWCNQIEENSFWFKHRNNCIISVVNKFTDKKVLFDIGGGNGFTSLALEKENIETVLVEPGINGILNAKKRGLRNLICSTVQNASFIKNSIPNIGIFDVLEHIENDVVFLKDLNHVLDNKGKLFITVPAFNFLWSDEDDFAGHYRRYTIKHLKKILKKAGFEIEYSTYFFSILPIPIFLFRTIPTWFSKKKVINLENEKKQHETGKSQNILDKIWKKEISLIRKSKKIRFGGSCLIVAKKKSK